jgi:hypothetical protein
LKKRIISHNNLLEFYGEVRMLASFFLVRVPFFLAGLTVLSAADPVVSITSSPSSVNGKGSILVKWAVANGAGTTTRLRWGTRAAAMTNLTGQVSSAAANSASVTAPDAGTVHLRAEANKSGKVFSSATRTVNITQAVVVVPIFNPAAPKTFSGTQSVSLTCGTAGAVIRYTTNGTDPTATSQVFSTPINLTATTTLKTRAFKAGMADSPVVSAVYTMQSQVPTQITLTSSPASGANCPVPPSIFKGRVLDQNGKGVAGVKIGVHDPVRQQSLMAPTPTDQDGNWTYTAPVIVKEGAYPFDFILDYPSGKIVSKVITTKVTAWTPGPNIKPDKMYFRPVGFQKISMNPKDFVFYQNVRTGMEMGSVTEPRGLNGEKTWKGYVVQDFYSIKDLETGLNIVFYIIEGAECIATAVPTMGIGCAPLIIHASDDVARYFTEKAYKQGVLSPSEYSTFSKARVKIVTVASIGTAGARGIKSAKEWADVALSAVDGGAQLAKYENINGENVQIWNGVSGAAKGVQLMVKISGK